MLRNKIKYIRQNTSIEINLIILGNCIKLPQEYKFSIQHMFVLQDHFQQHQETLDNYVCFVCKNHRNFFILPNSATTLYFIHILYTILPKLYLYFFYPKLFFVYNLYMSLIQISYQTLLTKLRDWSKLCPKEQLQLLQHAHSLMGKSFSLALHILDQSPHRISIIDFQKIYLLILDGQKYILFKRNFKARLNDCSCKNSWFRKSGEYAPFMCLHQILLQLSFSIFNSLVPFQRRVEESQSELLELLTII